MKFDETIYMDRFLPSADPVKCRQTQSLTRELIDARIKLTVLNGSKVKLSMTASLAAAPLHDLSHVVDRPDSADHAGSSGSSGRLSRRQ